MYTLIKYDECGNIMATNDIRRKWNHSTVCVCVFIVELRNDKWKTEKEEEDEEHDDDDDDDDEEE